jgi:fucose permease
MASVATGGTLTVTFFGVVVGPPLFGLIVNLTGTYRAGYAAVGALTLLCLVMLLRSGRRKSRWRFQSVLRIVPWAAAQSFRSARA